MAWVEQTKSGAFRLCDRVKIDGKWKRVNVPLEKDTPQARRKAMDVLAKKVAEMGRPDQSRPLPELIDLYLEKKICKESTRGSSKVEMTLISRIIGDDCELDPVQINQRLLESDKKPETINNALNYFRAFLRWCYRYGYINQDIAPRIVDLPTEKTRKDPDQKYLEKDELEAVLAQLSGMMFYLCKFLALTGLRIGEAAALTMEDVDERYIHVTKTYTAQYGTTSPKTTASVRDVSIQPELAELLTEYKQFRRLYMLSKGIRTDLLFFGSTGNQISNIRTKLNRVYCEKHIHPHIFRHTHVALLAEQGITLDAISRRLGHENSGITKDIYFHVTRKQKEKDEAAIAKVRIL